MGECHGQCYFGMLMRYVNRRAECWTSGWFKRSLRDQQSKKGLNAFALVHMSTSDSVPVSTQGVAWTWAEAETSVWTVDGKAHRQNENYVLTKRVIKNNLVPS